MNVKSLGYVLIETRDLEQWRQYGTGILGMMEAPAMPADGNLYLKMDARPFRFAVQSGETDRLLLCGWELDSQADFAAAGEQLAAAGVAVETATAAECAARRVTELLRLTDPSGNRLELYWGGELDYARFVSPVGVSGLVTGFNGDMGLGHAVLPAPGTEFHARSEPPPPQPGALPGGDALGLCPPDGGSARHRRSGLLPGQGAEAGHPDHLDVGPSHQ